MPIDKCQADGSLLAAIITNKYRYHLPLERQLAIFQSLGVDIAKSTFNSWATKSIDLLKPLTDELHQIIRQSNYLNVDETI
ncbi:MAG: transposase, partial [Synergistaceae bacterium]